MTELCPHNRTPRELCNECLAEGVPQPLPEQCCAKCLWWSPNRGVADPRERMCWRWDERRDDRDCCEEFCGPNSTEANVPDFLKKGTMTDPNPNKMDGPTEVLIISHANDFQWLDYALRSIKKYFAGFQGVTVAHPRKDEPLFATLRQNFDVRLHSYDEVPGKGHIQHMAMMASADTFLPTGTKYLLTTDSDGIFKMASQPEHFAWQDKPYWIVRSWDSLTTEDPKNPGAKIVSDNLQWRPVTDAQLGFPSELFTMCVNCQMIPLDLLAPYRKHIESVHRKPFLEYILEGRNEFPPTRVDFNALGAYFHKFHRDRFHWFDVEQPPFPSDRKKSYWSHGGFNLEILAEIAGFLK